MLGNNNRFLVVFIALSLFLGASGCKTAPQSSENDENGRSEANTPPLESEAEQGNSAPSDKQISAKIRPAGIEELATIARDAWENLPDSPNGCPDSYDYFPQGGIQNFYCHLTAFAEYENIEAVLGIPIFVSGPHDGQLKRNSTTSFGHYNPEFVRHISKWAIPAANDPNFRRATRSVYQKFVAPLAYTYMGTWEKLQSNPGFFKERQEEIQALMRDEGVPADYYEQFFPFMNPLYLENQDAPIDFYFERGMGGDYDGNVVKSAVGFWLRRGIDGTAQEFSQGLRQLIDVYESDE